MSVPKLVVFQHKAEGDSKAKVEQTNQYENILQLAKEKKFNFEEEVIKLIDTMTDFIARREPEEEDSQMMVYAWELGKRKGQSIPHGEHEINQTYHIVESLPILRKAKICFKNIQDKKMLSDDEIETITTLKNMKAFKGSSMIPVLETLLSLFPKKEEKPKKSIHSDCM